MIACTHPGKIGDCIYSLPTVRKLSEKFNTKVDFYTSSYCANLKKLFEYQPYINNFIVSDTYNIERLDMGVQPWNIDVPDIYENVFHLGFREVPNTELPIYMAKLVGMDIPLTFSIAVENFETLNEPYITIAPRCDVDFISAYQDFVSRYKGNVVVVGAAHEYPGFGINKTGLDFLESATWISKSIGFIGISSMFVLADFFNIPKVVLHKAGGLDTRHLTHNNTSYINTYDYDLIIRRLLLMETYSKTMDVPNDYEALDGYSKHFTNIIDHLKHNNFSMYRYEHEHRKWEYGLVYKLIDIVKAKTILDVGGGGSILDFGLAWLGLKVTVVDPGDISSWIDAQSKILPEPIKFIQEDFISYKDKTKYDIVTSVSTIEHIPNDIEFIIKLGTFVKSNGLLILTFDFHPDGTQKVGGHVRTYNNESINNIITIMKEHDFSLFDKSINYSVFNADVNGCTFASLVLKKVK